MSIQTEPKKASENIDDILADMYDNIPTIQPHVVDKVNTEKNKETVKTEIPPNSGEKFNPEIHAVNNDGTPKKTKTGKYRKKIIRPELNNPFKEIQPEITSVETNSLAAATVVQNLKRSAYHNFLGCAYADDRHKIYIDATRDYFIASGGVTLTPLHTILLLEGALLLEAMGQPKARDKITRVKIWFAEKYYKFKGRRKRNDPQPDNRPVDERENDPSKEVNAEDKGGKRKTYFNIRP